MPHEYAFIKSFTILPCGLILYLSVLPAWEFLQDNSNHLRIPPASLGVWHTVGAQWISNSWDNSEERFSTRSSADSVAKNQKLSCPLLMRSDLESPSTGLCQVQNIRMLKSVASKADMVEHSSLISAVLLCLTAADEKQATQGGGQRSENCYIRQETPQRWDTVGSLSSPLRVSCYFS